MRSLFVLCAVVLAVILSIANGLVWEIDTSSQATTVVGVGTYGREGSIAGAAANGVGAFVEIYNGTKWTRSAVQGGLLLDAATSDAGVSVATSMYQVFVSADAGKSFTVAPGIGGISQAAYTFGPNNDMFGLVGSWVITGDNKIPTTVSGVATSRDKGATWDFSASVPTGYVRYGAFPSEQTWYVSSGIWGDDAATEGRKFSSFIHLDPLNSKVSLKERIPGHAKKLADGETTGWFGAISKTTDGGKTWTQVFSSNLETDYYYFNGIACSSVDHCTAVAEGEDGAGGFYTVAYTTFDGGNTWEKTYTGNDASMMGVDYITENEGWIAGTKQSGRNLVAQFYHTLDGGKTFKLEETLTNCFALDLDFAPRDGTAIAACASSSGASCFAALYH